MPDEVQDDSEYQPRWNELITFQEAAKFSGLSLRHLGQLANDGEIWAKYLVSGWFTTEGAIRDYLDRSH